MGRCKGDWDSWVGVTFPPTRPNNDGRLVIGQEQANGKFKGKHKKAQEFDVDGLCKKSPDHIEFTTGEGFSYHGEITSKQFEGTLVDVAEGKRRSSSGDFKGRKKPPDDDWVAVKVT